MRGIQRGPVNSPHKWPVTRKMFPFDDVIMWPGRKGAFHYWFLLWIRWKIRITVIRLLTVRSHRISAHATTAQMSYHVHHFVAITLLVLWWEQGKIPIEFELQWKKLIVMCNGQGQGCIMLRKPQNWYKHLWLLWHPPLMVYKQF